MDYYYYIYYYLQEFLKSEVSVENILFWLACENFRKIPAHNTEKVCYWV